MVDETRPGLGSAGGGASEVPSRAASLGALFCILAIIVGVAGQATAHASVAWAIVAAFGFGALASRISGKAE